MIMMFIGLWVAMTVAVLTVGCITCGQSGGGSKATTLLAMPSAKGLFHKAIVQSGSFRLSTTAEQSGAIAAALLEELNVPKSEFRRLHEIPADRLISAGVNATRRVGGPRPQIIGRGPLPGGWSPTVDGRVLPVDPSSKEAIVASSDIPIFDVDSVVQNDPAGSARHLLA